MEFYVVKQSCIESCEGMHGLVSNYLKNNDDLTLKKMLSDLDNLEIKIRNCNEEVELNKLNVLLNGILNDIEVIINE